MSETSNIDSLNNKQGPFKPSIAPTGPMMDQGVSPVLQYL